MSDFKPCPFCGGRKIEYQRHLETLEITGIYCRGCRAIFIFPEVEKMKMKETYGENAEKWLSHWNRRDKE